MNSDSAPRYDIIYSPLGASAFGGAERSLLELAIEVSKRGRRVLLLAEEPLRATLFPAIAAENGLDLMWVDWAPEHSFWHNLVAAIRTFSQVRGALIHFNVGWRRGMWIIGLVARLMTAARILGSMRVMPDPHNLIPRRKVFGFLPGLQLWHVPEVVVGRLWAKLLHLTVSVNAGDYPRRLVRHYGFNPARLRVIHNGIHLRAQPLEEPTRAELRATLGVADENVLLCYVGRLSIEKGVHLLLEALSRLPLEFRLVVIGDGPQEADLKALADSLGVHERVKFLGFVAVPGDYIAASDMVIVPSIWYEAFGRVVAEGMNQGVPIVASKIGGMAELYDEGVEGAFVEPGSVDSLTAVLRRLGSDRAGLKEMGRRARARAEQSYAIERVRQQYSTLYDELLPPAGAPALISADDEQRVTAATGVHIVGGDRFARNLLANWTLVVADVAVAFFLTPLIISSLTLVVYGIWSLINSLIGYMGLVDLGMRGSVGRYVNHYLARRDNERVNQVIVTSIYFLTAVSVLALGASYLIALNFEVFFKRTPPHLLDTLIIVLPLMALNLWVLFVSAVFRNVLESFDRFEISNGIGLVVLALRTAGVVYVLRDGYGFVGLAIVTLTSSILALLAHWVAAKILFRPLSLRPRFLSIPRFAEMWRFGVASFLARSASHVIYQTDQILVMIFFGPAMVGIYSVAALLVQNGQRLVDQISSTLYPSVMKAGSLQDRAGLAQVYMFQARIGLFLAVLLYIGYIVFGQIFIGLWMGPGFEQAKWVLIILSLAEIASVMSSNGGSVLFSLDKIRPNLIIAGIEALANLVLSILLAAYSGLGMAGVALGTLLSMTVMQGVIHPWYTTRQIGLTYVDYLAGVGARTAFTAVAGFLLFGIIRDWGPTVHSWWVFLVEVGVAAGLYLIFAAFVMFHPKEIIVALRYAPLIGGFVRARQP